MSSIWYKGKPTTSGLYPYEQWTLLTRIVYFSFVFASFLFALTISGIALSAAAHQHAPAPPEPAAGGTATADAVAQPPPPPKKPNLYVRLAHVEGLDPRASSPASPAFQLVVYADRVPPHYTHRVGGGNSMLRVSHRGIILAWGHVPWFCVEGFGGGGQSVEGGGVLVVDSVVTVEARAEGAVLREEVRRSVQNDLCAQGKARFTVEGEVAGLGYLHCETSLFQGNAAEVPCPCLVQ